MDLIKEEMEELMEVLKHLVPKPSNKVEYLMDFGSVAIQIVSSLN